MSQYHYEWLDTANTTAQALRQGDSVGECDVEAPFAVVLSNSAIGTVIQGTAREIREMLELAIARLNAEESIVNLGI